ncbi:PhzF family phenazine biosynthesis protein [Saccharospirillum mangrovi]|uniref:PhzF family phenazine biosynthesis protein n=1 Tax=Saccharospirillum mangrovi TaxID=2161747 RepID=UPI000D3A8596|nr:PhzF family phenazine biosynthesis protein [Saccharospirillum mangrovi]
MNGQLKRYTAFTTEPSGGNPAGVWVGDHLPSAAEMQQMAADVGYSETAFIAPAQGAKRTVRYFSPEAEVPFCGHATIASGVVLGQLSGAGRYTFSTQAGDVGVQVQAQADRYTAALTSVEPRSEPVSDAVLSQALQYLGWRADELDTAILPRKAYAGAWHLVLAVAEKRRLDRLDYDFDALKNLMLAEGLTTLQLVWRESDTQFHARNPFPVGGVVEDPATGAAAAALGGYLRELGVLNPLPRQLTIHQGVAMGRPSVIRMDVNPVGGIVVSGTAVEIPG